MLAVQAAGVAAATLTHVFLHGDGSQFVYDICVDMPWRLRWVDLVDRVTIYITTAAPTQWATQTFHLSPMAVADLNGFVFFSAPVILFAIACGLVWRSQPRYLIFPVVQYAFSSSLGFGFPSEIALAPGFLWIALFLILQNRILHVGTFACLLGLIFTHELSIAPAVLVLAIAVVQQRRNDRTAGAGGRLAILLAGGLAAFAPFVFARLNGGGVATDANAILVFRPDLVLVNPTLWLGLAGAGAAFALALGRPSWFSGRAGWVAAVAVGVALPLALYAIDPAINFQRGRYESRTIVAVDMVLLVLAFAAVLFRARIADLAPASWAVALAPALAVALAVSVGGACAFLIDWSIALGGIERVVLGKPATPGPLLVSYPEALRLMRPDEARANDRMEFQWVLPYQSVVLADGAAPAHIIFTGYRRYWTYCQLSGSISQARSNIPAAALAEMRQFTCRQSQNIPPIPDG